MQQHSQRERIAQHIEAVYGVLPEYLWLDSPESAVFRHPASRKWFGIAMRVARRRLGLAGDAPADVLNVAAQRAGLFTGLPHEQKHMGLHFAG